ncbi:MAG: Apolipoprotein N-acyltransferase [Chlamydiia bacterium]|nr:Apolipoprotein N-acyltransferase [Chlamydiia bacterium]
MSIKSLYPLAAVFGLALFWIGIDKLPRKRLASFAFFATVQGLEHEWLLRFDYHGVYIFFVYLLILVLTALPFALMPLSPKKSVKGALALAGYWTLMEYILQSKVGCGFSLNELGLLFGRNSASAQLASVIGVLGLSFYFMFTNLICYGRRHFGLLVGLAFFPYLYGVVNTLVVEKGMERGGNARVALIQTGLRAEQKRPVGPIGSFVSPYEQWAAIMMYLKPHAKVDLIVLPEVTVPYGAHRKVFAYDQVCKIWHAVFRKIPSKELLKEPYAHEVDGSYYVSNAFFAKALADEFNAEVVAGFVDGDYNAAFHFEPKTLLFSRYEKQVLMPMAEILPLEWLRPITERYGVGGFLKPGQGPKLFSSKYHLAPSICYEEMLSHIMHKGRELGGRLFVNLTNDVWYPNSSLPRKHFAQARMRAIENGVPLVRSCNTGVTTAVDSLGRSRHFFQNIEWDRGALVIDLPLYTYRPPFSHFGDAFMIAFSILCLINYSNLGIILRNKKYQLARWTHPPKNMR